MPQFYKKAPKIFVLKKIDSLAETIKYMTIHFSKSLKVI